MTALPPSEPNQPLLPFDREGFNFRDFERFCLRWIKALPDVASAEAYGRPGDRQDGIDIVAQLHNGKERSYQCRKVKQFGPKAAETAIAEDVYGADEHVIVTACAISSKTRKIFRGLSDWKIQDVEDICASLLVDIPTEVARRIIDASFGPAVRKAFLGGAEANLFIEPAPFFEPFTEPTRLFRHTWSLVGREHELQTLKDAVEGSGKVVVLSGRGGVGKTRLLRALAAEMAQARLLFVADKDSPITADDLDDLPLEDVVVIVDDAHHRMAADLAPLLRLGARRSQPLTVVLATRPHGEGRLRSAAISGGYASSDVVSLPALPDLGQPAVIELARQALGSEQQWAEQLAAVTADCPLVTVVGGQLLAQRRVNPALLERVDEFREEVLGRWQDELLGSVSAEHDPARVRDVLKLLAAAGPINVEHEELLAVMSGWLEITPAELRDILSVLEAAGVVVSRGRLRRIVPDVLADHILHRACLDQQGRPNGFADELLLRLAPVAFEPLLRNLAELDWRVTQTAGAPALLDEVWETMTETFRGADAETRISILKTVRPVAAYQPRPALDMCRLAIDDPVDGPVDPRPWWVASNAMIQDALPAVLRGVGLHRELAPEVFELLWGLGRDRPDSNPGPDHPIRTLRELGDWAGGHPELVVEFVARLLVDHQEEHAWHPLDLLDGVVAREGDHVISSGIQWQITPWFLSAPATAKLRTDIFDLVGSQLTADTRAALRAANLFALAMTPLRGTGGARPSDETRDQWRDEQLALLGRIEKLWDSCKSLVRARLVHDLRWHAAHDAVVEARQKAAELIGAEHDIDVRILEAMAWPFDLRELSHDELDRPSPAMQQVGAAAAAELGEALPSTLNELLAQLDSVEGLDAAPDELLQVLVFEHAELAAATARWALKHTDQPLARYASTLMALLATATPEVAAAIAAELTDANRVHRRVLAARRLAGDVLDPEALAGALADEDESVRMTAVSRLTRAQPTEALIELALGHDPGSRHEERLLSYYLGRAVPSMTPPQLRKAGQRVAEQRKLDWAWARVVIAIGARDASLALDVLLARVERAAEANYDAVPYERFNEDPLSSADEQEFMGALRRVRGLITHMEWAVRDEAAVLFWHLARDVDLQLAIVLEWLDSDDEAELKAACRLLSRMDYGTGRRRNEAEPWELLLNRPWFAVVALTGRERKSEELEHCTHALIRAIEGFSTGRQIGSASARAIQTAEVARRMAALLPPGPAQEFYATITRRAEDEMASDALDDEEFEDRYRG